MVEVTWLLEEEVSRRPAEDLTCPPGEGVTCSPGEEGSTLSGQNIRMQQQRLQQQSHLQHRKAQVDILNCADALGRNMLWQEDELLT